MIVKTEDIIKDLTTEAADIKQQHAEQTKSFFFTTEESMFV